MPALRISGLKNALIGPVDLSVDGGSCQVIEGPSGAGKSLLLRAIADLDPSEGDVSWSNRSRDRMPAPAWRQLVGLVPAESGWWADSVRAHFDAPDTAKPLLAAVGLPQDALDWEIARLSTGERQRMSLVRAIARRPVVLLLDEPTAALDEAATKLVEDLLTKQIAAGVAIVLVTHDRTQGQRLSVNTKIAIMAQGRLTFPEGVAT